MLADLVPSREGVVRVERAGAGCNLILVCEHASHAMPAERHGLGLGPEARTAHIAWDPGALAVARALSRRLDATLISAECSRLIYDLNRPPEAAAAMPVKSELYDIPGNLAIDPDERLARTRALYLPFHETLHRLIAGRLALGRRPAIATIHSFTPVYFGQRREVELGIIHDADPGLAEAVLAATRAQGSGLRAKLNAPYDAADGVTHTLRLQATPYGLANVMLEIRNDLIATEEQQEAMAETLQPVLERALATLADEKLRAVT